MCINKEAVLTVQNNPIKVFEYLGSNRGKYPCRGKTVSEECLKQRSDVMIDNDCREPLRGSRLEIEEKAKICRQCPTFAQAFTEVVRIIAIQLQEETEKYSSQS